MFEDPQEIQDPRESRLQELGEIQEQQVNQMGLEQQVRKDFGDKRDPQA
jgi:hypothetical protein